MIEYRHLPRVSSFVPNPIVFFTTCTHKRRKLLACTQSHVILRGLWERSAERDGWWVGHYILMPDHVHFFARRADPARPMAKWMQMWKSVSSRQLAARWMLRHLSGNRITLIVIFGREKIMGRNGITRSKMSCAQD